MKGSKTRRCSRLCRELYRKRDERKTRWWDPVIFSCQNEQKMTKKKCVMMGKIHTMVLLFWKNGYSHITHDDQIENESTSCQEGKDIWICLLFLVNLPGYFDIDKYPGMCAVVMLPLGVMILPLFVKVMSPKASSGLIRKTIYSRSHVCDERKKDLLALRIAVPAIVSILLGW